VCEVMLTRRCVTSVALGSEPAGSSGAQVASCARPAGWMEGRLLQCGQLKRTCRAAALLLIQVCKQTHARAHTHTLTHTHTYTHTHTHAQDGRCAQATRRFCKTIMQARTHAHNLMHEYMMRVCMRTCTRAHEPPTS
jgi:hypothetical protein